VRVRVVDIQIAIAATLECAFGIYQLITINLAHETFAAGFALASIAAGCGLAFRQRWSIPLVFILAIPEVIVCGYGVWVRVSGPPLDSLNVKVFSPLEMVMAAAAALYCCYVAAVGLRRSRNET
jgi:hypothetical protein